MSENKIAKEGIDQLSSFVKSCSNLLSIDLRGNEGYNVKSHAKIAAMLKRNIKKLKSENFEEYELVQSKRLINNEIFVIPISQEDEKTQQNFGKKCMMAKSPTVEQAPASKEIASNEKKKTTRVKKNKSNKNVIKEMKKKFTAFFPSKKLK